MTTLSIVERLERLEDYIGFPATVSPEPVLAPAPVAPAPVAPAVTPVEPVVAPVVETVVKLDAADVLDVKPEEQPSA